MQSLQPDPDAQAQALAARQEERNAAGRAWALSQVHKWREEFYAGHPVPAREAMLASTRLSRDEALDRARGARDRARAAMAAERRARQHAPLCPVRRPTPRAREHRPVARRTGASSRT